MAPRVASCGATPASPRCSPGGTGVRHCELGPQTPHESDDGRFRHYCGHDRTDSKNGYHRGQTSSVMLLRQFMKQIDSTLVGHGFY